ncbi:ABC-2 family transporter protein [candidate division WWE3 bacterium]|uniref:ABC-2 family transporter protein n=1 Tax=candidate division WWE3 bacterium TaxID=2053526 RepID=A0A955LHF2_UNCKA|nr:ABC-2 family transporter protein [candidate division WWE3 bacterium]
MQKYLGIFRNYFSSSLEYRSNLIGLIIKEMIGMGVILVLWVTIYQSEETVGGYSLIKTVHYYVLVPFIGIITQVQLSNELGKEIKDGLLSSHLTKPYKLWIGSFMRVLAEKIFTLSMVLPLYILLIIGLDRFFDASLLSMRGVLLGLMICLAGFILHFFLDLAITWLAFWTDDVWSFKHFKDIIFGVLGGVSFPFEFLTPGLQALFHLLPFKFMYYIPLSYMLGDRGADHLVMDLLGITVWIGIMISIAFALWQMGVRKYGAYGG